MRLMHPLQISVPKRLAELFASSEGTSEQASKGLNVPGTDFPLYFRIDFLRRLASRAGPLTITQAAHTADRSSTRTLPAQASTPLAV
jgi:hypothetical protein